MRTPSRRRRAATRAVLAAAAAALAALAGSAASAAPDEPPKAPAPAGSLVPVESFFRGKVVKVEGTVIELLYDFQDAGQLADFGPSLPFRAIRTVEFEHKNGKLNVRGTGSVRHKAVFEADCGASASLAPRKARDFGFAVTEERESEVFTLYCCYDRYFGAGDNVSVPQNMIIKFLARDPKANANGLQDWRYCGSRGQKPEISVGKSFQVACHRNGMESRLTIDDWESKGKEAGRDLTSMQVALYGYDCHFDADDLTIRGKLDPQWIAKNHVDLTTWKPPVVAPVKPPEPAPGEAGGDPGAAERIRAKIAGYPLETKPQAMAALLRDAAIPVALREEAAEKAKTVGTKKIVPFLTDGLYSADLDSRRLACDVLKSVVGKTFNYRPDAPEETRKKAIRDLNEYLQKNAAEFL
jgi:hypothetical protein